MPVLVGEVRHRRGDVGGQPFPVTVRHHPVMAALPDVDRDRDRVELETPRPDECHVVVEPAPVGLAQRLAEGGRGIVGEGARQGATVHIVDEVAEQFGNLVGCDVPEDRPVPLIQRDQRLGTLECRTEPLDVLVAHPIEVVETLGRVRSD